MASVVRQQFLADWTRLTKDHAALETPATSQHLGVPGTTPPAQFLVVPPAGGGKQVAPIRSPGPLTLEVPSVPPRCDSRMSMRSHGRKPSRQGRPAANSHALKGFEKAYAALKTPGEQEAFARKLYQLAALAAKAFTEDAPLSHRSPSAQSMLSRRSLSTLSMLSATTRNPMNATGRMLIPDKGGSFRVATVAEVEKASAVGCGITSQIPGIPSIEIDEGSDSEIDILNDTIGSLACPDSVPMIQIEPAEQPTHLDASALAMAYLDMFDTAYTPSQLEEHSVVETTELCKGEDCEGNKMINDYAVISELGRGSYAKVKLVMHDKTDQPYALKIMNKSLLTKMSKAGGLSAMDQVRVELAIMKKISHPGIVRLHQVIDDPSANKLYLVLDYVDGGNICDIDEDGTATPLDSRLVAKYLRQICSALGYLHRHNIVHRDIKPSNILVDNNERSYLCDFGVSTILSDSTQIEGLEGTPLFFAPEMCEDADSFDGKAADIWALGATMYVCLLGRVPFFADSAPEIIDCIQNDAVTIPYDADPDVRSLLRGMLNKSAKKRLTLDGIRTHPFVLMGGEKHPSLQQSGDQPILITLDDVENAFAQGSAIEVASPKKSRRPAVSVSAHRYAHRYCEGVRFKVKQRQAREKYEQLVSPRASASGSFTTAADEQQSSSTSLNMQSADLRQVGSEVSLCVTAVDASGNLGVPEISVHPPSPGGSFFCLSPVMSETRISPDAAPQASFQTSETPSVEARTPEATDPTTPTIVMSPLAALAPSTTAVDAETLEPTVGTHKLSPVPCAAQQTMAPRSPKSTFARPGVRRHDGRSTISYPGARVSPPSRPLVKNVRTEPTVQSKLPRAFKVPDGQLVVSPPHAALNVPTPRKSGKMCRSPSLPLSVILPVEGGLASPEKASPGRLRNSASPRLHRAAARGGRVVVANRPGHNPLRRRSISAPPRSPARRAV
eukprot:TRINITY_DN3069_c1_g1_i1.p1 TRINITY_DN3069_c1_g1~~TRINITY_DN3069_c1_g1_i1.p1  ORF type:complete len:955 (+),score=168.22 TRINITY_DN3069_c1_g1_i1:60-2924(+)